MPTRGASVVVKWREIHAELDTAVGELLAAKKALDRAIEDSDYGQLAGPVRQIREQLKSAASIKAKLDKLEILDRALSQKLKESRGALHNLNPGWSEGLQSVAERIGSQLNKSLDLIGLVLDDFPELLEDVTGCEPDGLKDLRSMMKDAAKSVDTILGK